MNVVYRRGQKSRLLPMTGEGNPVKFVTQSSKSNYKAVIDERVVTPSVLTLKTARQTSLRARTVPIARRSSDAKRPSKYTPKRAFRQVHRKLCRLRGSFRVDCAWQMNANRKIMRQSLRRSLEDIARRNPIRGTRPRGQESVQAKAHSKNDPSTAQAWLPNRTNAFSISHHSMTPCAIWHDFRPCVGFSEVRHAGPARWLPSGRGRSIAAFVGFLGVFRFGAG
jgi:hypothetical protein